MTTGSEPQRTVVEQTVMLLRELGNAYRGDWSMFDGRCLKKELNLLADALERGHGGDINDARDYFGLCRAGGGHWTEYCAEGYCPPSASGDSAPGGAG